VKVLEYLGLENFYQFFEKDLEFKPVQNLANYQLGIAMGALEMNLMDLSKYFTIFPQEGVLKDLKIFKNEKQKEKKVVDKEYVQLVNKILNDRKTGIEQFGLKSELNLFQENYALKTGTSKDFKDSWILGFTPDFLVAVWVGNTENEPMEGITGQKGAGKIWAETMELLFNSEYNKKRQFDFSLLKEYNFNNQIEYGLAGDDYEKILNILENLENSLILNPHDGDHFLLEEGSEIILKAKDIVDWFVNDKFIGNGKEKIFLPEKSGFYQIKARKRHLSEEIIIFISE
jgi:membrane carboxypeptidase/penicillin-binding protein PbpC